MSVSKHLFSQRYHCSVRSDKGLIAKEKYSLWDRSCKSNFLPYNGDSNQTPNTLLLDENMKDLTVDKVLSMASNLGVVNKSNKHGVIGSEELEQCAGKTIEYIEENKLPKYSTCVRAIYDALLKGQEPISEKYLSNKDDKKELERE